MMTTVAPTAMGCLTEFVHDPKHLVSNVNGFNCQRYTLQPVMGFMFPVWLLRRAYRGNHRGGIRPHLTPQVEGLRRLLH